MLLLLLLIIYSLNIDEATETILDESRFMEKTFKNLKVF